MCFVLLLLFCFTFKYLLCLFTNRCYPLETNSQPKCLPEFYRILLKCEYLCTLKVIFFVNSFRFFAEITYLYLHVVFVTTLHKFEKQTHSHSYVENRMGGWMDVAQSILVLQSSFPSGDFFCAPVHSSYH